MQSPTIQYHTKFLLFQQVKENGGLAKLVAFVTDTAPPEEEDKKSKDKKGAASRAGKKGKGGDDGEY